MREVKFRKSEEYVFDTVKNISIGLIVSALVAILVEACQVPSFKLILGLLCGIIQNIIGYLALRIRERKGAVTHERS